MDAGKLPNALLADLLAKVQPKDPRVLLGPGIGRDAAVIDTGGPRLLVAKSDPVTFAGDQIGWYAVHVNANDIACMGAQPCWFMATVLLPDGASEELARAVFQQVADACESLGVELVGGHTEITIGLHSPIVSGAMLGEVDRGDLVQPSGAREGDTLILTKGIAIEGTALLARETPERLEALGVPPEVIERAQRLIFEPGISVLRDAMTACESLRATGRRVHAMHDPTEGGLATALYEMAEASGLDIVVGGEEIAVLPETQAICNAASLQPLGLLASGALLIAVAQEDCRTALDALAGAGVLAARIGRIVSGEGGVIIDGTAGAAPAPRFARDEVARFLAG